MSVAGCQWLLTIGLNFYMDKDELPEVFCHESNFAVLRMPGRAYPGVLIQGDSLMGIIGELEEAIAHFNSDRDESLGCLKNAYEELAWRLKEYRKVCEVNDIR